MAEISTIARPYAVATYNLAKEKNTLASWSDMLGLMSAVGSNKDMQAFINDPNVIDTDLEQTFIKACGDQINDEAKNFIRLLVEYDRLPIISSIASAFETLKAQDEGVVEAQIISAVTLSESEVDTLVEKLEAKFNKKIEATFEIDPEILGGIKIIVGDTVIDATVKNQLQNLAYTLSA